MASDDETRERSASPAREAKPKKNKPSGFKWKEKKAPREEEERAGGRLERGYRDRSPRRERDSYRDRDDDRSRRETRDRSPRRRDERGGDSYRPDRRDDDKPSESQNPPPPAEKKKEKKDKKDKKPKPVTSSEPMIIVNVNDRLGTKAAIPCLASDSVKAFKAMVAAHIGRQPHEIMIKRQGERPFKDQLTLEDYSVSNGVQLDLELDTGD